MIWFVIILSLEFLYVHDRSLVNGHDLRAEYNPVFSFSDHQHPVTTLRVQVFETYPISLSTDLVWLIFFFIEACHSDIYS